MERKKKQIIALGGGGFSGEPADVLLDFYFLKQTGKVRSKVCFVPTATGDAVGYINRFYECFQRYDCELSDLTFFRRTPDIRSLLLNQDLIFVGGGNTKSMLAVWRDWGVIDVLREAWESGIVLSGVSAGAICWFEQGITDSYADRLESLDCLGFLQGSLSPHFDSEPERRPAYRDFLLNGRISGGIALDDGVAARFEDGSLVEVVSSKPNAKGYRVFLDGNSTVEEPLKTRFLGTDQ